jgi:hypothetical protein
MSTVLSILGVSMLAYIAGMFGSYCGIKVNSRLSTPEQKIHLVALAMIVFRFQPIKIILAIATAAACTALLASTALIIGCATGICALVAFLVMMFFGNGMRS